MDCETFFRPKNFLKTKIIHNKMNDMKDKKKVLELFSGTHSIGKVCKKLGYGVVSLDRDIGDECPLKSGYKSDLHFKEDIFTWDYKKHFKEGDFELITASPVCLFWSNLRSSWIGRKCKSIHPTDVITKEILQNDIDNIGKPMVDKIFEIIDYFKPKYYWIENPKTGRMKEYITDKPFYDVDYCKYSDYGYKKSTRFWTNIKGFEPKICKNDCENLITIQKGEKKQRLHKENLACSQVVEVDDKIIRLNSKELRQQYKDYPKKHLMTMGGKANCGQKCVGGGSNRLERYRIPSKLIEEFMGCLPLQV